MRLLLTYVYFRAFRFNFFFVDVSFVSGLRIYERWPQLHFEQTVFDICSFTSRCEAIVC